MDSIDFLSDWQLLKRLYCADLLRKAIQERWLLQFMAPTCNEFSAVYVFIFNLFINELGWTGHEKRIEKSDA
jgi:hypothetical protein